MSISITLPDKSVLNFDQPVTVQEVAESIGPGLAKATLAGIVNDKKVDNGFLIERDAALKILTPDSPESLELIRHSTAHVLAQAVTRLFSKVQLAIGPSIKEGFYYDFDLETTFSPDDLVRIEKEMNKIIAEKIPFQRLEMTKAEAMALLKERGDTYKIEMLEGIEDDHVSFYQQGEFLDWCRGPHLPDTGKIKAFKLLKTAGAYWRGDEKRPMLQRVYGTAFPKKDELEAYLHRLEEAVRRDHRKLGKELDLFSFSDEVGAGLVIYHPKGAAIRYALEDYLKKEHVARGYQPVIGPQILKVDMWKTSGHYQMKYPMYFTKIEEQEYGIKPMNCLAHIMIYKAKTRSYRDLPLRLFELGTVHRHEKSGVLHGLLRLRGFTQDDAHIFCLPDQLLSEIKGIIDFVDSTMSLFGFTYELEISTRPEKSIGSDEDWEQATAALKETLDQLGLPYDINEGDGAFYGPKIDIKLHDAIGRSWQCATIQCDFSLPARFDLSYVATDGSLKRPVMLHRVIFGSLDRFFGILIEHYAGAFPVWLAPTQVRIIPVSEQQTPYAERVADQLRQAGIRVDLDSRNEKLGYRIREGAKEKIPYLGVVGEREAANNQVALRKHKEGDLGSIDLEALREKLTSEIANRQ